MKKKSIFALSLLAIFALMSGTMFLTKHKVTVTADSVTATYDYSSDKYNRHWQYDNARNMWSTYNVYDIDLEDNLVYNLYMIVETGGEINVSFKYRILSINNAGLSATITKGTDVINMLPEIKALDRVDQTATYTGSVSKGDIISISYKRHAGSGYDYSYANRYGSYEKYNFCEITGLPFAINDERSLQVEAQEGGKVAINDNAFALKDSFTGTKTDTATIRAVAENGYYFAGWIDSVTNENYSSVTDLEVNLELGRKLIASFVKESELDLTPVFATKDDNVTWDKENLKATFTGKSVCSYEATYIGEKTLILDFAKELSGYFYVYVDGKEIASETSAPSWDLKDESKAKFKTFNIPLEGTGVHKVKLEAELTYLSDYYLNKFIIKSLQVVDGVKYADINLELDDRLGYVEYQQKTYHNGDTIRVFSGLETKNIWRIPYSSIQSTIDTTKTTYSTLAGLTIIDGDYTYPKDYVSDGRYDSGNDCCKKYIFYNDTIPYKLNFQEVAIAPSEVIVETYVENSLTEQKTVQNRDEITLPFGKNNMVAVKISDFANVNDVVKVYVNDVETSVDFAVGYNGFILENVSVDTTIRIITTLDGYTDADDFYIYLKMTSDATIDDLKLTDNITFENDNTTFLIDGIENKNEWVFAPEYSSVGNYVFKPGNAKAYKKLDGSNDWSATASSNLKISVKGSGVLTFYAKFGSNSYSSNSEVFMAVLYNIGAKITLNKVRYSYVESAGTKLWYNKNYVATDYITAGDDGWSYVQIPVSAESDTYVTDLYLAYLKSNYDDHSFYIKDMAFLQGEAKAEFSVYNNVGGEIEIDTTIQKESGKENYTTTGTNETVEKIVKGSTTTFTAKASTGYKFFAFVDKNNNVLSYNETYSISQVDDFVIKAVFIKSSDVARIGFETYSSLKDAINSAKTGDTIYLLNNTIITENLTIPSGVKLVMPIEIDGTYTQVGTTKNAQSTASFNNPEKYLLNTLTINSGITLTIDGEFVIGAVQHYVEQFAQGITSGKYNQVLNNGNIIVNGELRVYGLIDGTGKIELNGGATLYEPYLVNNFSGGTDTEALYNANQFPFEQYDTINIRTELKVNYDARVIGMTSLYFWGATHIQDVDLVGKNVGLIQLTKPNSYIISTYNKDKFLKNGSNIDLADSGKRTLHIYGGAVAGNFSIQGYGSKGMFLAIPYTFDIYLHNGTYEIPEGYGYKVMPGANFVVEEDATLNVNGILLVYSTFANSSMDGKIYPSTKNLTDYGFDINGVFVVNGTLNINGTFAGYIQSKVVGATINVNENAILDVDVVNGAKSEYDCNIVEFNLKAKIITENGNFVTIEKNKSYKTTSIGSKQTSGTTFNYVINTTKDEADSTLTTKLGESIRYHKMINYIDNSSITINGIWAEVHEHSYVIDTITYATENTNGYVKYHCSNDTCNYEIEKTLLYLPTILGTYTYTGEEIEVLFNNFDKNTMEIVNPQIFKNAGGYQIQITLKNFETYAWSRENFLDNILELNLTIDKKQAQINSFNVDDNSGIVKNGNILEVVYSGNEYNVVGFIQDGRLVEVTYLSSSNRVNVGEYRVRLVANENGNYKRAELEITLKIVKKHFEYNFADKQVDYTGIPKNAGEFIPIDFTKNYDLLVKFGNKYVQEITTAGTYLIIVTINEANYFGTYTFNVVVNKIDVDFDLEDIKDKMIVKANSISFASLNNIEYSINGVDYSIGAKVFENLNALQTYTIYVKHLGDDNHKDTIKTFKQKTTRKAQDVNNLIDSLPEEMNVKQETFGLFKQINAMILEVSSYEQDQIDKTKLNEKIAEYNNLVEKVNGVANEAKEISNIALIFRTKVYAICGNGTSNVFNIMLTLNTLATAIGVVFLISKRKFLG